MTNLIAEAEIDYPETDAEQMGEASDHWEAMVHLFQQLRWFYRNRPDVLIACNLFWYSHE